MALRLYSVVSKPAVCCFARSDPSFASPAGAGYPLLQTRPKLLNLPDTDAAKISLRHASSAKYIANGRHHQYIVTGSE